MTKDNFERAHTITSTISFLDTMIENLGKVQDGNRVTITGVITVQAVEHDHYLTQRVVDLLLMEYKDRKSALETEFKNL